MPSAEEWKQRGNDEYMAGRAAEALECYSKALAAAPPELLHVLHSNASAAHYKLGQHEAALQSAQKSLGAKEDWAKGYVRQAQALLALHRPGHAEAALLKGLQRCKGDVTLKQELASLRQEDGDQSLLRGYLPGTPAQKMRDFQSEQGLAMHGPQMLASLPCDAFRYAFLGNAAKFRETFQPASHISLRAWALKLPICSVIVSGAQRVQLVQSGLVGSGHAEIMRQVCEAGARVDAKDVAGWTALAHATAHHPQLELARILLEHGADASIKNRFGSGLLHSAVMCNEVESVRLLLEAGADPSLRDPDGISPESMAVMNPQMLALCQAKLGKNQQNAELQKGAPCMNCGKPGATQRCSGCMVAIYCSRQCQREHWKAAHKQQCSVASSSSGGAGSGSGANATASEGSGGLLRMRTMQPEGYQSILPMSQVASHVGAAVSGKQPSSRLDPDILRPEESAQRAQRPSEKMFTIKVQVPLPLFPGMPVMRQEMLVYNKTRSYLVSVPEEGADACKLARMVRERGVNGQKGYFMAKVDKSTGELVISDKMLPIQPW